MCLMAFAIQAAPGLPLLLAANRDEALDRPTLPLHRWTTPHGTPVVAGRDERDGGTWLGTTGPGSPHPHSARVAMLTNVRQGRDTTRWPRSRGELPLRWLDGTPLDTLTRHLDPTAYGAFNLVVGDLATGQWHWLTNRPPHLHGGTGLHCQALTPGVYGLSNAGLDTPWPKTLALRTALQQALPQWTHTHRPQAEHALWTTLADRHVWPDDALPHTGVPLEWERALSAIWVDHPQGYGTRTSALLSVVQGSDHGDGWEWTFQEHTWRPEGVRGLRVEVWGTGL
jgi:uncharacterized protein with NRDE domain